MGALGCKVLWSICDNAFWKLYLCHLDSKHRTPYQIERNYITEDVIVGGVFKMSKILNEHHYELGQGFLCASTGFLTDPHCKEQFCSCVIDLIAEKYYVMDMDAENFLTHNRSR